MDKVILKTHNKNSKVLVYNSHEPKYNFLKYWRIVRKWATIKYELSTSDLEVLLYLYDEGIWKKVTFLQTTEIHSWEQGRLNRYIEDGLVRIWRQGKGYKGHARLYELTPKAKRICKSVYLKLTQEETIPENKQNNPIYLSKNKGYSLNYYRKAIQLMNKKREKTRQREGFYNN